MDANIIRMAEFVGATDMAAVAGAGAVATPEVVDVGADAHEAVPAQGGAGGARPPMRWNNNTSRFVLRRMVQIVSDGSRADKCFKDKDVNYVAKALLDYCGEAVSPTQVYNHLRK